MTDTKQKTCDDAISRQWLMECVNEGWIKFDTEKDKNRFIHLVRDMAPPVTPDILADALMEERIRGKLDSDTTFEKDIIRDVKCRLTVSIRDHRPCYCGAGLREVWRESEK